MPVCIQDEYSNLVQEWNRQRSLALERALLRILYPLMVRELKAKLLEEAKQSITRVNNVVSYYVKHLGGSSSHQIHRLHSFSNQSEVLCILNQISDASEKNWLAVVG